MQKNPPLQHVPSAPEQPSTTDSAATSVVPGLVVAGLLAAAAIGLNALVPVVSLSLIHI